MNILLYLETGLYVLLTICVGLTVVAVIFLVVRPFLDPRWRDVPDDAHSSGPGTA